MAAGAIKPTQSVMIALDMCVCVCESVSCEFLLFVISRGALCYCFPSIKSVKTNKKMGVPIFFRTCATSFFRTYAVELYDDVKEVDTRDLRKWTKRAH